jgi:hypothetical protein
MRLPISILITFASFCVLTAVLYLLGFYAKRKKPSPLVTRDLLPNPGQSLLAELDMINREFRRYCVFAVLSPVIILAVHLGQSYFGGAAESGARLMVSAGGGLSFCLFPIYKAITLRNERRIIRLGYEGELAVGRELEQFARDGFHVYHGFPAETSNIDHVVVGPKGVFAVETKTYAKPAPKDRVEDATVEYDGRMLYFPKASWLSDWLGKAIGEPIAARAIVALPGWFVKRTSAEGIPVVNPKQFSSLFKHIKPRPLSDSMIMRIKHQLEKK